MNGKHVHVLKSGSWGTPSDTVLPFRIDRLRDQVGQLTWTEPPAVGRPDASLADRITGWAHRRRPTSVTTALGWPVATSSDSVLSWFESPGHPFAAARLLRIPGARKPAFAVVSCWLADLLPDMAPARLRLYRQLYARVDRLYYFSTNQTDVYHRFLGLDETVLRPIDFGIDVEAFGRGHIDRLGVGVLVVGRDAGRDWQTTFAALGTAGISSTVLCRPNEIAGCHVPSNVRVLGRVPRDRYLSLLQRAESVVVATRPTAYPGGQSVLLEAMATGTPTIATATPALRQYLYDEATVTVPPGDAAALGRAILRLHADPSERFSRGTAGEAIVRSRFGAARMWSRLAADLTELAKDARRH